MKTYQILLPVTLGLALASCNSESDSGGAEAGASLSTPKQDGYALASNESFLKAGMKLESTELMTMTDATMVMDMQGQKVEGTMSMKENKKLSATVESPEKVKIVKLDHTEEQKVMMGGQEAPTPPSEQILVGVPLVLTLTDGEWVAVREDGGELTEEEQDEADDLGEMLKHDEAVAMYGLELRKPGDSWTVDAADLPFSDDTEDIEGSMELTFDKVESYEGQQCAFLSGTFTMSGTPDDMEEGMTGTMKLEGSVTVIRSLDKMVDLSIKLDGATDMNMDLPMGTLKMGGPMNMEMTSTVK